MNGKSTKVDVDTRNMSLMRQLFFPGFYLEKVDTSWKQLEWYGVFESYEDQHNIGLYKKVILKFNPFHDDIVDGEGEMMVLKVSYDLNLMIPILKNHQFY